MSFAEINEVFRSKGIANYFEYSQEISRLLHSGHIVAKKEIDGVERFYITDLGIKTSTMFEKDVPAAIRETTLKAAQDYYLRQRIDGTMKSGWNRSVMDTISHCGSLILAVI